MNDAIAPTGTAIAAMSQDRNPRRNAPGGDDVQGGERASTQPAEPIPVQRQLAPIQPPADAPAAVIPGALFSTSQLAQGLRRTDTSWPAFIPAGRRRWSPPDSAFRLKDKTI